MDLCLTTILLPVGADEVRNAQLFAGLTRV